MYYVGPRKILGSGTVGQLHKNDRWDEDQLRALDLVEPPELVIVLRVKYIAAPPDPSRNAMRADYFFLLPELVELSVPRTRTDPICRVVSSSIYASPALPNRQT